jgi:hypothetical protein
MYVFYVDSNFSIDSSLAFLNLFCYGQKYSDNFSADYRR